MGCEKPYSLIIDDTGVMWGERSGERITPKSRNIWRIIEEARKPALSPADHGGEHG